MVSRYGCRCRPGNLHIDIRSVKRSETLSNDFYFSSNGFAILNARYKLIHLDLLDLVMMIIERQTAGGASTGSASGEAIERTSFLHKLLYRDCSLIRCRFHTFVYSDPITDTAVPTASKPESSVPSVSNSSEVRILRNDRVSSHKTLN